MGGQRRMGDAGDESSGQELIDKEGIKKYRCLSRFVLVSAFTHYFTSSVEGCTSVC